jgi:hypothetical protein
MNIVIKKTPAPLKHTPMVVDGSLSDKLDKYEVLAYLNAQHEFGYRSSEKR